ncbi:RNase H domain-containing protein [Ditylenchus destructor]|nr:RNase H domain-containing protein [Ditylenchus destructor]
MHRLSFVEAIEIVQQAIDKGEKELTVRTESDFLYNCMTRWVSGWKKNGWKKSDGQEVKLKDLIQELDDLSAKLNVKYELIETSGPKLYYRYFISAIEIVKQAIDKGEKKITVRTESNFLYKCMTQWISGWKANDWKKSDGQEVVYKDLIQELDDLSAKLDVKYELVEV